MKQLTIKEIFKALEQSNNLKMITGEYHSEDDFAQLHIYLDDMIQYTGTSFKEFKKYMKETWIETFNEIVFNLLLGSNIVKFTDEFGDEREIEIYIF